MLDPTLDVAHPKQLSKVVRYVDIDYEKGTADIKETFIDFLQVKEKDAAVLEKLICKTLEEDQLPLSDCCSQCYDNAAVMTGHISGLQQRILAKNPKAIFINCDNLC